MIVLIDLKINKINLILTAMFIIAVFVAYINPANATTHTVWIDNYALAPSVSKISIGDSVKWINMDRLNQITYTIKGDNDAWIWDPFDIKFLKNHTITFDKPGVYNYIAEGATVKIKGSIIVEGLILKTGYISVSSTPYGANIYLDGTYRGITPSTISDISIGYHTIKLTKSGYKDYTEKVRVYAGKTVSVSKTLAVIPIAKTPVTTPPTKTYFPTEYIIVGVIALFVILLLGFALRPRPRALEKAVLVTRETEFYNGFLRLKISVANQSKLTVNNVALDLDFEKYIFRYDRHEPEFPILDNKIQLGSLDPNTSKTVAIYLDPMICTKTGTNLNCRVDYKDSYGNPKSVQMKTKKVKVVCPIFLTESDINIGILKELLENLPFHDSKVYKIQTDFEIDKLMEICKEVIQRHDVRHIRTFATKDKKTIETWYYGKTKVEKNDLIIKASVNTDTKSIEIFSATQNQESLTGILAELGHKLSEKITRETKNQKSIQQIINIDIKDSIIQRSNLLSFCDLDGKCTGEVVVQDSVIQRSQIGFEKNKCPNCRKEVQTGDKFCRECGFKLR